MPFTDISSSTAPSGSLRWIPVFAVVYFAALEIGHVLRLDQVPQIWPATGVFVGMLVVSRMRLWPLLVLTALAATAASEVLIHGRTVAHAAVWTVGATVEATMAASVIRGTLGPNSTLSPIKRMLVFVLTAGLGATMLGSLVGGLGADGLGTETPFWLLWRTRWYAGALGLLTVGAALLAWVGVGGASVPAFERRRIVEVVLLLVTTAVISYLVFSAQPASSRSALVFPYVVIPLLLWAALRFDLRVVSAAVLMISMTVAWFAVGGLGPFSVQGQAPLVVLSIQAFIFVSALTAYTIASIVAERRHVEFELQQAIGDLRHEVRDRVRAEQDGARLQEQVHGLQKMEAIGQLASGVAHDFNNLLTVISAHTHFVKRDMPESAQIQESIRPMEDAVEQATAMSRSLLSFSQRLRTDRRPIDLVDAVRKTARMLERLLPATIRLRVDLPTREPAWVVADAAQMQQVVMNLAVNARDAMPEGGELSIVLEVATDPDFLDLSVTDNGAGMSAAVRERVFEPFFTTKPPDKGTGLGLAVVRGIVLEHGGRIEMDSEVGRGTCFKITLPGVAPGSADPEAPVAAVPRGRGEVILLAEDNDQIRGIVAGELIALGYEVIQARDGAQLLDRFEENHDRIDALFIDVELPRRSGLDCLRRLREDGAALPAIVTTGTESVALDPRRDGRAVLLPKPFEVAALGRLLRGVLDAGPDPG